jgi:hypothetical protein
MIDETASATKTDTYLERNARYIPGGLFSLNRRIDADARVRARTGRVPVGRGG